MNNPGGDIMELQHFTQRPLIQGSLLLRIATVGLSLALAAYKKHFLIKKLYLIILFLPFLSYSQTINLSDNESTSISPQIISNKNIFYTFWKDNNDGNYDIYFRFYFEGNWSDIKKINTSNNIGLSSICIDDSNYVHLLWIENDADKKLIYGRILDSTLIDSIEIYKTDTSNIGFSSSFFDESTKQLHVTFEVKSFDTSFTYYLFEDTNYIWSDKQMIISSKYGNNKAQIVKDKDNKIVCLWFNEDSLSVEMMKKIDTSWTEGTKLTDEFEGIGRDFVAVNDDSLNIQLVSHPGEVVTCPCNWLLYSKWNGYQWSAPEAVPSNNEHAYYTEHNYPCIALSKRNYPVISWQQNSWDIYLNFRNKFIGTAVKTDAGWHVNTSLKFHKPEDPSISIDNDDNISYAWQDSTGGDYDIYFYKTSLLTSIEHDDNLILPGKIELIQNYPNPFNPTTNIEFSIPKSEFVTLKVYNILGEEVATLASERLAAGKYKYDWDASRLASGVYLYRIQADDFVESKKMVLLR